jgi:hypothetical protein
VADAPMTSCCFAGGCAAVGGVAADILVAGDAGGAVHFLDLHHNLHPDLMCMYQQLPYSEYPPDGVPRHNHVERLSQVFLTTRTGGTE